MKKIFVLIVLYLLLMCSCSSKFSAYGNQEKISMNYNNITNYCNFWMTTDSICYLEDSLVQKYFLVDKNFKTKISENKGYGFGKIQRYNEKIYMLDESNNIDEYNSKLIMSFIKDYSRNHLVILSTHDIDNALNISNYLIDLNKSKAYLESLNEFQNEGNFVLVISIVPPYNFSEEEYDFHIFYKPESMNNTKKDEGETLSVADENNEIIQLIEPVAPCEIYENYVHNKHFFLFKEFLFTGELVYSFMNIRLRKKKAENQIWLTQYGEKPKIKKAIKKMDLFLFIYLLS